MNNEDVIYRIRRKPDGKYSKGGVQPDFGDTGKCYVGINILKQHLREVTTFIANRLDTQTLSNPYKDCEIISYSQSGETSVELIENIDVDIFAQKMRKR